MNTSAENTVHEEDELREPVYVDIEDKVATVTLNHPDKLNAITWEMWELLHDTIRSLSAEDDLRCIILRGAGTEAFSPGCDINEFASRRSNREQGIAYGKRMHDTLAALYECRHPMIAQIYGICVGAGLEIAAQCDMRICGESATFGAPIKNLGLVMAYPEIEPIVRVAGRAVALEILLEGRIFDAKEALQKGLVTRVVPNDMLAQECFQTARRIASGAPLTARWHKQFIRRMDNPQPITAEEYMECFECFDTEDFRTGCAAFLLHNHPEFQGR